MVFAFLRVRPFSFKTGNKPSVLTNCLKTPGYLNAIIAMEAPDVMHKCRMG